MNNTIDLNGIRKHWQEWAKEYGTNLRATTKASTAKAMELEALSRALTEIERTQGSELTILEVGCGNGHNCLSLTEKHSSASFTGIDFIEDMVEAANSVKKEKGIPDERVVFQVGNVLNLALPHAAFDVIFTDRCLINLNTDLLQQKAIASLAQLLKPNGYLLMIENSQQTYDMQNHLRELVGLPKRTPAEFNHFFNEEMLLPFLPSVGLEVLDVEDFISLHDIVLYILVPMVNDGKVDYDHPLVEAATKLNIALSSLKSSGLGKYGQNRLYKCRKVIGSL